MKKIFKNVSLIAILICFLSPSIGETPMHLNVLVVWNIGQGQWITHISADRCLHFDVGGEFNTFSRLRRHFIKFCSKKTNEIYLTHWDYDHILNLPQLVRHSSKVCWRVKPLVGISKHLSRKILKLSIPSCTESAEAVQIWHPEKYKNTNDASLVFVYRNFLISGDSPKAQELVWSQQMDLINVKVLLLGHHGSRTSTSKELLKKLTNIKMSIASARRQKYGHPHPKVLMLLQEKRLPILKTEDWGHLWFETNVNSLN